jgi:hypothetical protein
MSYDFRQIAQDLTLRIKIELTKAETFSFMHAARPHNDVTTYNKGPCL